MTKHSSINILNVTEKCKSNFIKLTLAGFTAKDIKSKYDCFLVDCELKEFRTIPKREAYKYNKPTIREIIKISELLKKEK